MQIEEQVARAKELMGEGYSQRAAAAEVGLAESTLRYKIRGDWRKQGRQPKVVVSPDGSSAEITGPINCLTDPETLMRKMGLSPDEWIVTDDVIVNQWGDIDEPNFQLKLRVRRKSSIKFVTPAIHVPPVKRPTAKKPEGEPRFVVVCADQQAPFHDERLHEMFLQFLEQTRPDEVVLAGDTLDFPDISRHRDNPEWHAPAQQCINSGYRLLRDYVEAAPQAEFHKLLGNHDERLRTELLNRAERLYGITAAPTEEDPYPDAAMGVKNLLHLDALGINLIQPDGNYTHAQHFITPQLAVRHGWLTGNNTADKSLRNIDFSLIVFHTHRQSVTYRTVHTSSGDRRLQMGVEGAAMCRVRGGIGYAVDPNWQQGFVTAWVWPDGTFKVDHATVSGDELFWGGERFTV